MANYHSMLLDISLKVSGLESKYWARILRVKLNVSNFEELKFEDHGFLEQMAHYARDDWEQKMLTDFLRLPANISGASREASFSMRQTLARKTLQKRKSISHLILREKQEQRLLQEGLTIKGFLLNEAIPREMVLVRKPSAKITYADKPHTNITLQKEESPLIAVPKAQCEINCETVILTDAVRKELQGIHRLAIKDNGDVQTRCEQFLRRFGTHVNCCTVEFGGVCQRSHEGIKRQVTKAKPVHGGSKQVIDLDEWEHGLDSDMRYWQVIYREHDLQRDFKPIWDVILEHAENIPSVETLTYELQQAFIHKISPSLLSEAKKKVDSALHEIGSLEKKKRKTTAIIRCIESLYGAVVHLHIDDGCSLYWQNAVKHRKQFRKFLSWIISHSKEESGYMRSLLRELVQLAEATNLEQDVVNWLNDGKDNTCIPYSIQNETINDVPSFLRVLQDNLIPSIVDEYEDRKQGNQTHTEIDILMTKSLALIFEHVRKNLSEEGNIHQMSLLLSIFSLLAEHYDGKMGTLIVLNDIKEMVKKGTQLWEKFEKCRKIGRVQTEAYLVNLHFCMLTMTKVPSPTPSESVAWNPLRIHLQDALKEIITSSEFDWQELTKTLGEEKLVDTGQEQVLLPEQVHEKDEWNELLELLEISKYYPGKITMKEVMTQEANVTHREVLPKELPWSLLKRLTMVYSQSWNDVIDYSLIMKGKENNEQQVSDEQPELSNQANNDEIVSKSESDHSDTEDTQMSSDEGHKMDTKEQSDEEIDYGDFGFDDTDKKIYNPLDILLAVFSCCDLSLRRIIVRNMASCGLAIPFVYPGESCQSVMCSLWALRNIHTTDLNDDLTSESTQAIIDLPSHVISFIRLGRPSMSKSVLLNNLINEQKDTFLNRNSNDGDTIKRLADGMIETHFQIAHGKKTDPKENRVLLNLRGDACEHKQQISLMSNISNAIVVFIDNATLNDVSVIDSLKDLYRSTAKVMLIVSEKDPQSLDKTKFMKSCKSFVDKIGTDPFKSKTVVLGFKGKKERTITEMKTELRSLIQKCLGTENTRRFVDEITGNFGGSLEIDEMQGSCRKGKLLAERVLECIAGSSEHTVEDGPPHTNKDSSSKGDGRKEKENIPSTISPSLEIFLACLAQAADEEAVEYFLWWLTSAEGVHQTNDPEKGEIDPTAKEGENRVHCEADVDGQQERSNKYKSECNDPHHLLNQAIVLYEHRLKLRLNPDMAKTLEKLPKIVASLLLKGYSMKLSEWLSPGFLVDVFECLQNVLGNQQVFTMSLVGDAMSANATMFDIMFGPKCPIENHGFGTYIRLAKLDGKNNVDAGYAVLFETFGPEDEDVAVPFKVGLSDIILLSMKEEEEKLKKVIEGLLDMKSLNDKLKKSQQVVFIKQNDEDGGIQREALPQMLNRLTKESVQSTEPADTTSISDVIDLDIQKHIWDFSEVPILSREYFKEVDKLKKATCDDLVKPGSCRWYMSDIPPLLTDMGNAARMGSSESGFCNILGAKAVGVIQNHVSELQCALGMKLDPIDQQLSDTELFTSVLNEDRAITDTELIEVTSRVINSPLPAKYHDLLQGYLLRVDELLKQQEARCHGDREHLSKDRPDTAGECLLEELMHQLDSAGEDIWRKDALKYLHAVYNVAVQLHGTGGTNTYWADAMRKREQIKQFLTCMTKVTYDQSTVEYMKNLISDLTQMAGSDACYIPEEVTEWLNDTGNVDCLPPVLNENRIDDIPSLLSTVETEFLPYMDEVYFKPDKVGSQLSIQVNKELSLLFEHVTKQLLREQKHHEFSIVVSMFSILMQSLSNEMTRNMMLEWIDIINQYWKDFEKYGSVGMNQLEAYLIFLHFSTWPKHQGLISFAWNPLGAKLEESFRKVITSSVFKWQTLTKIVNDQSPETIDPSGSQPEYLADVPGTVGTEQSSLLNEVAAKAVDVIQNRFSGLQCALGLTLTCTGQQHDDTDLLTSVIKQQSVLTFEMALEATSKIQNSMLPVKYEKLLQRYLNKVCATLKEKEARKVNEERVAREQEQKAQRIREGLETVLSDHRETEEAARQHRLEQKQLHTSKLQDRISAKKKEVEDKEKNVEAVFTESREAEERATAIRRNEQQLLQAKLQEKLKGGKKED